MSFGYNFHDVVYNTVNTTATVTIAPAAGNGHKNYLLGFYIVSNAAVTVTFANAGGSAISGPIPMAANVPLVVPFSPVGLGATNTNTALNMVLNTAVQVSGAVTYLPWF